MSSSVKQDVIDRLSYCEEQKSGGEKGYEWAIDFYTEIVEELDRLEEEIWMMKS